MVCLSIITGIIIAIKLLKLVSAAIVIIASYNMIKAWKNDKKLKENMEMSAGVVRTNQALLEMNQPPETNTVQAKAELTRAFNAINDNSVLKDWLEKWIVISAMVLAVTEVLLMAAEWLENNYT